MIECRRYSANVKKRDPMVKKKTNAKKTSKKPATKKKSGAPKKVRAKTAPKTKPWPAGDKAPPRTEPQPATSSLRCRRGRHGFLYLRTLPRGAWPRCRISGVNKLRGMRGW